MTTISYLFTFCSLFLAMTSVSAEVVCPFQETTENVGFANILEGPNATAVGNYTEIAITQLPSPIKIAVADSYGNYDIVAAYVGNDESYKIVIENMGSQRAVFYRENGELIKEEVSVAANN